mmetsp:Transcript_12555/g.38367  ORF Transcript_12555/g.38367 Transcript_12555/m.38367 type:complete len:235 (+) Transcript_12555:342-1046(+)
MGPRQWTRTEPRWRGRRSAWPAGSRRVEASEGRLSRRSWRDCYATWPALDPRESCGSPSLSGARSASWCTLGQLCLVYPTATRAWGMPSPCACAEGVWRAQRSRRSCCMSPTTSRCCRPARPCRALVMLCARRAVRALTQWPTTPTPHPRLAVGRLKRWKKWRSSSPALRLSRACSRASAAKSSSALRCRPTREVRHSPLRTAPSGWHHRPLRRSRLNWPPLSSRWHGDPAAQC